jgi:hypothetical protein
VHPVTVSCGQEAFFEGHAHAFAMLGGVPYGKVRYDNLRSVAVPDRAAQDAVSAGSGWLRSPALLAGVVERRLSSRARDPGSG